VKGNARERNMNADNAAADVEIPRKGAMSDGVSGVGVGVGVGVEGGGGARLIEYGLRGGGRDECGATRRSARRH